MVKTRTKAAVTMHIGEFIAHERIAQCVRCKSTYSSDQLTQLVPKRCKFGFDVLVYVGKALFLRHRCNNEIIDELASRNIYISSSEIDYLGKKFIVYLSLAHRRCAPKIKTNMHITGGYILHLDGTYDGRGPILMSGLDSITEIVLSNIKVPSEKADEIIPFLRQIKKLFGRPKAIVHDMGRGILKAVAKVFPDTPNFICHFHFLRDIGKDLFGNGYAVIRSRLKAHGITSKLRRRARALKSAIDEQPHVIDILCNSVEKQSLPNSQVDLIPSVITYSLIQWILDGKHQGHGYGFPFDQPHLTFADRLLHVNEQIKPFKTLQSKGSKRHFKPLLQLANDLNKVVADKQLRQAIIEIDSKINVFNKLREAMRIASETGCRGLNCDGSNADIKSVEKGVAEFHSWLCEHDKFSKNEDYQKVITQIDKYWEKLFCHPIIVNTPSGQVIIQPQRTNNILERFFRSFKRANRRKTGNNSMGKTLQAMLADTPLIKNLENHKYLDILLNGKTKLEEVFAEIDAIEVRKELKESKMSKKKIPAKIKKIIAKPFYPERISNILRIAQA
jgi:hypothetical protein